MHKNLTKLTLLPRRPQNTAGPTILHRICTIASIQHTDNTNQYQGIQINLNTYHFIQGIKFFKPHTRSWIWLWSWHNIAILLILFYLIILMYMYFLCYKLYWYFGYCFRACNLDGVIELFTLYLLQPTLGLQVQYNFQATTTNTDEQHSNMIMVETTADNK